MNFLIHQGDQFALVFNVKVDGLALNMADIDAVRIKVNSKLLEYPNKGLVYDSGKFLFTLTEAETRALPLRSTYQVGVKANGCWIYGESKPLTVDNSIITEDWLE